MHSAHRRRGQPLLSVALVALLALSACAGDTGTQNESSGTRLNDADVAFLEGMIPHHRQAVTMARMMPGNTDRPQLNRLAEDIVASQTDEIDTMRLLWGAPGGVVAGMGHEGHDDMAMEGMMSGADMRRLMPMDGRGFDLMFTEMMIAHHQDAIEAAEEVLGDGRSPTVARLARRIIDAQQREIDDMRRWRRQWL
jgi:uncharacterized protein (DUF305 family)